MTSARLRGFISAVASYLGVALIVYGGLFHNPFATRRVTYDYMVWAAVLLSLYSLHLELKTYRGRSIASSLVVSIAGGVQVLVGRVLSLYINSYSIFGYFGALVGEYYSMEGFLASGLVLSGSAILSASTTIHALLGGPLEFSERPRLCEVWNKLGGLWIRFNSLLDGRAWVIAALSGLFAFCFRFIVEVRWWEWLIGWDTPEHAAHLMDFMERLNPFTSYYWMGSMRNIPPLLNMVLAPFTLVSDAWTVFKIYPSVAYAIMAGLSALATMKVYRTGWRAGLLAGALTSLYILNLMHSYQYHRQLLGAVMMLAAVLTLETVEPARRLRCVILAATLLTACGLSHEVTGLVGFTLSLTLLYRSVNGGWPPGMIAGAVGAVANALLEIWYWRRPYTISTVVGALPVGLVSTGLEAQSQALSYLVAGYGLTLPFVMIALTRRWRTYAGTAVLTLFTAGVSPLIAPYSSVTTWYRFLMGAAPLVTTLTAVGVVEALRDWRAVVAYTIVLALPSVGFAYGYNLMGTYTRALREFPDIMTPAPPDREYLKTYEYFKNVGVGDRVIIADNSIARYVHLAIRNPNPQQLIWIRGPVGELKNTTVCDILGRLGVGEAVIASTYVDASTIGCVKSVEPVSSETPWIMVVKLNTRHDPY
ncbi:MAG: hypothetical protein QW705_06485 [Zestosphaera sp.]